jgi:Chaperone of endosialidase
MKNPIQLTKAITPVRHLLRHSPWRRDLLVIPLVLASFALSPAARAVDPPPDGGYPNFNTAEGDNALFSLDVTTAFGNTAVGSDAMSETRTGASNTAVGASALFGNSANYSTGIGALALSENAADYNTAIGYSALWLLRFGERVPVTGGNNTASGAFSLASNTSGTDNTASGSTALFSNEEGSFNTANGSNALYSNTGGSYNTAGGSVALYSNISGIWNTASGWGALYTNIDGSYNTADGLQALYSNTSGTYNTACGLNALYSNNTGSNNIALGTGAGGALTTGSNNIDIGNAGVAGESAKIRIGTKPTHKNTYIAGIYGVTVSRGIGVIIDNTGHLGTTTSSARFKDKIQPMDKASEAILALKPVTFRYKQELDPECIPQFGLVAEQVEKVNPDLVAHDEQGKPYTVRYEAVNAMLLNEFLKEHRKVEEQEAAITELRSLVAQQRKDFQSTASEQQREINVLIASLREQASQIQRVTRTRVEVSKFATGRIRRGGPVSQMVADNE